MRGEKWLLAAGHYHLFHIISPLVARSRRIQQPLLDSGEIDAAMIILKDVAGRDDEDRLAVGLRSR